jgi:alpha-1,2-mannosyltransferase
MKRWPRGVLVGLAAAVKLTPAVFVLFFLARKDFKSTGRSLGVFAVCGLASWWISPSASEQYWTEMVFSGVQIQDPGYIGNQSLRGMIARIGWDGIGQLVWAALVVLVMVATWLIVRRAVAANQPVLAVLACAVGGLLASPISWTHHWVWICPGIGVLCWLALPKKRAPATAYLAVAALAAYVFIDSPLWDHQSVWPLRESYVLFGLVFLAVLALLARPKHSAQPLDDPLDALGQRGDVVRLDRGEHADP